MFLRIECSPVCSTVWSISPKTSKTGIIPMALAPRMNTKNVRMSGAQVRVHFAPTLGTTMASRM